MSDKVGFYQRIMTYLYYELVLYYDVVERINKPCSKDFNK